MKPAYKAVVALAILAYPLDMIARESFQAPPEPVRLHTVYGLAYRDYSLFRRKVPEKMDNRQKAEAMVMLFSEPRQ